MRRRLLRVGVGIVVVVLALLDVEGLIQTLRTEARLRGRVVRGIRDATSAALPRLAAIVAITGAQGYSEAAHDAIRSSLASEVEFFDLLGRPLYAYPGKAPVHHWPGSSDLAAVESGQIAVFGPVAGDAPRVLVYLSLRGSEGPVVARLARPAPELAEDLRERRELLIGHALSLFVLLLAAGLAFLPSAQLEPPSRSAFDAYEEAMMRLRDRGLAVDREHEEERLRLTHDLEDKSALARAGELAAGIAHEVRNGLSTILGYARLVERKEAAGEVGDAAARIREECETLETVVRRFMDFVRRETLAPASFDMGRLLSRVVSRESRSRPGPKASVSGDLGTVVGDEELLERAFENLIRNALEAAGPGGHVSVEASRDERNAIVSVRDDGPGMSPEILQHLRPFYTTKPGGLGLGLALAFKVVGLHGGALRLSPGAPRGLVVTVSLPLRPEGTGPTSGS